MTLKEKNRSYSSGNGKASQGHAFSRVETHTPLSNVVHKIGREIVSGDYKPGVLLPNEAEMLTQYSVSRTALREAYSKLAAKGLIIARPKVGTSVREKIHWNMLDPEVLIWHLQTQPAGQIASHLYALRRMLEPGAAELAAEVRSDEDMKRIEAAYLEMEKSAADEMKLIEADFGFHVSILSATGNPFLNAFSALIHTAMISTFELSWRGAEISKEQRIRQHGEVAEAIKDQNQLLARKLMEKLLDDAIHDVDEALGK